MNRTRYCAYCQCHKPDEGFKFILHPASNSKRAQCGLCQARRKLPRSELNRLAAEEVKAKRLQASENMKSILERKRKGEQ